jgi:hypothetical protein
MFCPVCGSDLGAARAFVQEYWSGQDQHFLCWCPTCRSMSTVTVSDRVVLSEPEH